MNSPLDGAFDGRRALVTGSSRNLGAAIAEALAWGGASVAVTHRRSPAAATALVARLEEVTGRRHTSVAFDAATPASVRDAVATAAGELGGHVDILVNNVGPYASTPFVDMTEEEWDRVWDANVKSAYVAAQATAPAMRAAGWGRIVNLSAVSAYVRNRSIYTLAKSAIITLTETLALELAPDVTVNAVAPGQIAESLPDLAEFNPEWAEKVIAATPLQRLVTRTEVAHLVVLLCSHAFDAVTGVTIPMDGGLRIGQL